MSGIGLVGGQITNGLNWFKERLQGLRRLVCGQTVKFIPQCWAADEMMFCTTFLSAPSEEVLDSISRPDGGLVPLQCLVLSEDELNAPLPQPCLNTLLKFSRPSISTEDVLSGGNLGQGRGHRKLVALTQGRRLRRFALLGFSSYGAQRSVSKASLGHFQKY